MTDFKNRFGAVTNTGSENVLDFAAIDERAAMQSHRTGEAANMTVVFHAAADVTGSVTPRLQHCDDANATIPAWSDLVTGAVVTNPKAGNFALIQIPQKHKRYIRAIIGAAQAGITAFYEPGASAQG